MASLIPSQGRSALVAALLQQAQRNQGRPSYGLAGSLDIAAAPILASLLAKREERAQTQQAQQARESLSKALGLPQPTNIVLDDVMGGPSETRTLQPAMTDEQKRMAALLSGLPQQGVQAAQMSLLQQAIAPQGSEPYTLSPGQVRYGANNQQVASVPEAIDSEKGLPKLVNDISDDLYKESTDFTIQFGSVGRIRQSAADPSAAGDMAMIYNYMKLLDPNSVVREAEYATAENARGVPATIRNIWNRVLNGERLAEEQRADFLNRAERLFAQARADQSRRNERFLTRATSLGVPEELFRPLLLPIDPAQINQGPQPTPTAPPKPVAVPPGPASRVIP